MTAKKAETLVIAKNSIVDRYRRLVWILNHKATGINPFELKIVPIGIKDFDVRQLLFVVKNEIEAGAPSRNPDRFRFFGVGYLHVDSICL